MRVGFGYDVHQLAEGRELWLGGVKIGHTLGLLGHSDADVLIHAICDALLGAAGLRDIGYHFPDNNTEYKGIDSKILLARCATLLSENGWAIENIDTTVCAEQPKINSHILQMQLAMAQILNLPVGDISIKATTNERLGFVGREEGIAAYAVALLKKE